MSLEKTITFVASCDFCSNDLDTDETEFMDAVSKIKGEDWKVFKDYRQEWAHKCPVCAEKERDAEEFFA